MPRCAKRWARGALRVCVCVGGWVGGGSTLLQQAGCGQPCLPSALSGPAVFVVVVVVVQRQGGRCVVYDAAGSSNQCALPMFACVGADCWSWLAVACITEETDADEWPVYPGNYDLPNIISVAALDRSGDPACPPSRPPSRPPACLLACPPAGHSARLHACTHMRTHACLCVDMARHLSCRCGCRQPGLVLQLRQEHRPPG
jgi:hypothetical protein